MITVGDILKKRRLEQGLSLDDLEKKIRVRKKFLTAIEENQWEIFPSKIYIVGLIKNYAKFLEIDQKKILAYFARDYEKKEAINFKKSLSENYFTSTPKRFFLIITLLIIGFFLVYFGYQIKLYFSPPKVKILSLTEKNIANKKVIKLIGQTEKEAIIKIAGQRIFQNEKGIFEFSYPLKQGKNQIIIEVTGANGKKTLINKKIINNK